MKRILFSWMTVAAVMTMSPRAMACSACFGKSDSPLAYGMNAGIFTLLAVIVSMLGLIASFFVFLGRRTAQMEESGDADPSV